MGVEHRHSVVFYTTAVCNLNCRYCYIDKNPALKEIDNILDESFKGDYYFNFTKKVFPDPKQLDMVQFWGGEPFLRLDRAYYTVEKLINYYPNLNHFMASTNFVNEPFFDQFFGLLEIFGKYTDKNFIFDLQLSIDGTEEITDAGRGKGVTKKFIKKFDEFIELCKTRVPKNVTVETHLKPTLDNDSFRLLMSEEKVIEYFRFLEDFYDKIYNAAVRGLNMYLVVPNMACPSPHTVEDGKEFAKFLQIVKNVEIKNKTEHYFKHYKTIMLFLPKSQDYQRYRMSFSCAGGVCDSGRGMVGLLPNEMISECHMSFVDLLGSYKEYANEHRGGNTTIDFKLFTSDRPVEMTIPYKDLELYENKVACFYRNNSTFRLGTLVSQIQALAYIGQVDKKYRDKNEALNAAYYLQSATSNCMRDNTSMAGSIYLYPLGHLRLLLNGAKEIAESVQK